MLGLNSFSMAPGADHDVTIWNDQDIYATLYDATTFQTQDVLDPSFFGYSATFLYMTLEDNLAAAFSSDTPSAQELTNISGSANEFMTVFFSNNLGGFRSVVLRPDRINVEVISPVPLPSALGFALIGLAGLGAMSRRKKTTHSNRSVAS